MGVENVGDAHVRRADAPEPPQKSISPGAAAAGDATVLGKKRKAMTHNVIESKKSRNLGWEAGLEYEKLLAGEDLTVWNKWEDGEPFSGIAEERAYCRFAGIQRKVLTWRKIQEEKEAAADAELAEIAAIDAACDEEASAMENRLAHGMGAQTPLGVGTHTDSDTESDEEPADEPVKEAKEAAAPAQMSEERAAESDVVDLTCVSDSEEEAEEAEKAEEAEEAEKAEKAEKAEEAKVTRTLAVHRRGKGQTVRVPSIAAEVEAVRTSANSRKDRTMAKKKSAALRKLMYEVSAAWHSSQRYV